jgi:signal peptidase I
MRVLVRELIETVILALLIFLVLQFSVQNFRVEGSSMESTLEEGDYLLVNKMVYFRISPEDFNTFFPFLDEREESLYAFHQPRFGEIVIFHYPRDPSRDFVKRVIGVPGDEVEIRNGQVYLNGEALDETYVDRADRGSMEPTIVPPDSYFVLGDNRRASNDSRDWGFVPSEQMIGRAWIGYWPADQIRTLNLWGGWF